jgi:dTMP kinase
VLELHRILSRGLQPDMTILMDSEVAASVARAHKRNLIQTEAARPDENRFEQENRLFFERVHGKFLEIAAREPERVFVVDARRPADVVFPEILAEVRTRLLGANRASGE